MRIHDHEQRAGSTDTERDETLFAKGVRVFTRKRVVVGEYRCRFRKRNGVLAEVGFGFLRIPVYVHFPDCMDKRPLSQAAERVLSRTWLTIPSAMCASCQRGTQSAQKRSSMGLAATGAKQFISAMLTVSTGSIYWANAEIPRLQQRISAPPTRFAGRVTAQYENSASLRNGLLGRHTADTGTPSAAII